MPADMKFQLQAQYPANLDRCRQCGAPRILHGDDGRCGLPFLPASPIPALLVKLGGLLALLAGAAWLLATSPALNTASVLAFGALAALVFAGAALALSRRG